MNDSTSAPPAGAGRHILCIDDSADILSLLRDVFEEEGYRVTTRTEVDERLTGIRDLAPDLILLDVLLGSAGGGWDLLSRLKHHPALRRIPVILLTGAVLQVQEHEDLVRELGVPVISKPFDLDELVRVVRETVDGPRDASCIGA